MSRPEPLWVRAASEIEIVGLRQRQAWIERLLPPVERLRGDLWSIPVPIPHSPLRYTSVYVFAGAGGLTLLDAGWESDEAWAALTNGLASIGAVVADVRGVLVSHMHFDHIGLVGRVRRASGGWVALHPADREILARPDFRDAQMAMADQVRWLRSLGATHSEAVAAIGGPERYEHYASMVLPDRLIEDGEIADVPGWSLRAVHTPGHTPGHLCFADERTQLFFSGDHLLPRISPNISASRWRTGDPLGDFLRSLQEIRSLDAQEVLPAHEWRFRGLAERVDQLLHHHKCRLLELLTAVRNHPGSAPWHLAGALTWSRPWEQYDGYTRISAVSETVAHLWHLVAEGRVFRIEGEVPRYQAFSEVDGVGASWTGK